MEPPPISIVTPFFSYKRLAAATPPKNASLSPSITFILIPSSFFTKLINSALFGASLTAEVATQSIFLVFKDFAIKRNSLSAFKALLIAKS